MKYGFWRFLNLKSNFLGNGSKTQGESFSNRAKNKMNRTKPKSLNSDHSVTADLANKLINFQFSCWTTRFTRALLGSFEVNFCFLNFYLFGNIFVFVQMVLKTDLEDLKVWENIKLSLLLVLSSDAVNHLWLQMASNNHWPTWFFQ